MRAEDRHQAGVTHFNAGRLGLAETALRAAAMAAPRDAAVQHDLGQVLRARGRLAPAAHAFEAAIAAAPDMAAAHLGLGAVRQRLDGDEAAEPHLRRAASLAPGAPAPLVALGDVLRGLGRLDEAEAAYGAVLRLSPNDAPARFGLGFIRLLRGDFAGGWPGYEFRPSRRADPPAALTPQWRGGDVCGKTLLLYAEQGMGDCIQFLRYAAPLADAGAHVIAAVPSPLIEIAGTAPGIKRIVQPTRSLPRFDVCCPLPSLPYLTHTMADTIPAPRGYLAASPDRIASWRARLPVDDRLAVAIAWAGNRDHPNDCNRSAGVDALAPLFEVPGVRWINLQMGPDARELRSRRGRTEVLALGDGIKDFADSAAILACVDLVIGVDTALCHLSGAMDRPTWLMLPFAPDWRWLLERDDTPWYPSIRLYRQQRPRDWAGVARSIAADLAALVNARRSPPQAI